MIFMLPPHCGQCSRSRSKTRFRSRAQHMRAGARSTTAGKVNRPAASALMPARSEGVHAATGTISSCIAFRHQHLQRDPAELQAWLERMTDPARRERTRHAIELGVDAPEFAPAVRRLQKLLPDMEAALAGGAWLAGPTYSLADLAYAPYMTRLDHLDLAALIRRAAARA